MWDKRTPETTFQTNCPRNTLLHLTNRTRSVPASWRSLQRSFIPKTKDSIQASAVEARPEDILNETPSCGSYFVHISHRTERESRWATTYPPAASVNICLYRQTRQNPSSPETKTLRREPREVNPGSSRYTGDLLPLCNASGQGGLRFTT